MRYFFYTLILHLTLVNSGYSRDLIITKEGDTIHCKIANIDRDYIYFAYKPEDKVLNTLIPQSQVAMFQRDYFDEAKFANKVISGFRQEPVWQLNLSYGPSRRSAELASSIDPSLHDYYNELKGGRHFQGGIAYYFDGMLGLGIQASQYRSSVRLDGLVYIEDSLGNRGFGELADDITIRYIGPSFHFKTPFLNDQLQLVSLVSIGYMDYYNESIIIDPYTFSGQTLGLLAGVGVDFVIDNVLGIGFGVSSNTGTITNMNVNDGETTEKVEFEGEYRGEGISRYDFTFGIRLNL